ncbi:MAG: PEGA domain-containing protein [Sandaracinaceae bacterium]|nr:PEGA domain-containing protein [Sandaracinaceae bacterium]
MPSPPRPPVTVLALPVPPPRPRRWRGALFAGVALVALGFVIGSVYVVGRAHARPPRYVPAPRAPIVIAPTPPAATAISTDPPGADVYYDGEWVGLTPFRLGGPVPRGSQLVLRHEGYEDLVLEAPVALFVGGERVFAMRRAEGADALD